MCILFVEVIFVESRPLLPLGGHMCILFVEVLIDYICCFINRLTAYLNSSQKTTYLNFY
jgi:hypothetical protein